MSNDGFARIKVYDAAIAALEITFFIVPSRLRSVRAAAIDGVINIRALLPGEDADSVAVLLELHNLNS